MSGMAISNPLLLQGIREVPVVQRDEGLDSPFNQSVDDVIVVVDPCLVDLSFAGWLNSRPAQ